MNNIKQLRSQIQALQTNSARTLFSDAVEDDLKQFKRDISGILSSMLDLIAALASEGSEA